MGSAEAESWSRCRSSWVEEMAEAVPRLVRAGRPRSRVGLRQAFAVAALEDALLPEKNPGGC